MGRATANSRVKTASSHGCNAVRLKAARLSSAALGGRRTPWIIAGMALLALGGFGAALATALMSVQLVAGLALAVFAFLLIGLGVGAAGTSVLTMLASCVEPRRRAAAATIVWVMMIFGFALTAPLAGHFLDPFSNERLIEVTGCVCAIAFCLASLSVWGVENKVAGVAAAAWENPTPGPGCAYPSTSTNAAAATCCG